MHRRYFIASGFAVFALGAHAETPDVLRHVPEAKKVGAGRFSRLGFDVFDATLFAPAGRFESGGPFALRLEYLRNIKGKTIVDSSVAEIRKQGVKDDQLAAGALRWRRSFRMSPKGPVLRAYVMPAVMRCFTAAAN